MSCIVLCIQARREQLFAIRIALGIRAPSMARNPSARSIRSRSPLVVVGLFSPTWRKTPTRPPARLILLRVNLDRQVVLCCRKDPGNFIVGGSVLGEDFSHLLRCFLDLFLFLLFHFALLSNSPAYRASLVVSFSERSSSTVTPK